MTKKKKRFTWADLKMQVNSLSSEMLTQEVMWWGNERGGKVNEILILNEEYAKTDEGYEPMSAFDKNGDAYYEGSELPIGCPIISVD